MSVTTKKPVPAAVFNIPNQLTTLRLALSIVLFVLMAFKYYLAGTVVFVVAASTDWLDGYLARKLGLASAFGAFLDPVADKLMVASALIVLVALGRAEAWLAIIIIGREIAISALREWMAQLGASKSVAVAFVGKLKTTAQMTAIIALLLYEPLIPGVPTPLLGTVALWLAAILTLWSMAHYLKLAAPYLGDDSG